MKTMQDLHEEAIFNCFIQTKEDHIEMGEPKTDDFIETEVKSLGSRFDSYTLDRGIEKAKKYLNESKTWETVSFYPEEN